MTTTIVVAAANAAAAKRLAKREDEPADVGPATNPERAAAGWRRYAFPIPPPPARAAAPPDVRPVVAKVRKLLALAGDKGATEGEATNAAAAAQRLIEEHALDDAMLAEDVDGDPIEEPIGEGHPLDEAKRVVRWRGVLANRIAKANGCRIYWNPVERVVDTAGRTKSVTELRIVGPPARTNVARALYGWLSVEIDRLGAAAAKGRGRVYGHAWRVGCASRVGDRVIAAAREGLRSAKARVVARLTAEAGGNSGSVMARVESAMARLDNDRERTDEFMRFTHPNLRYAPAKPISASGYNDGKAAGDSVKLDGHRARGRGAVAKLGSGR